MKKAKAVNERTRTNRKKNTSPLSKLYMALVFLFLYAPIVVLIIFSFNDTKTMSRSVWSGFTFRWYVRLWEDSLIQEDMMGVAPEPEEEGAE